LRFAFSRPLAAWDILSDIEPAQAATASKQKRADEKAVLAELPLNERFRD
jgi:hypothetical protein